MPDARISELPAATSPADTDLTALVQTSGASLVTSKATMAQLRGAVLDGRSAHVRDYGAKGDGTTNDAPAIQAAINDLASKGGGVLMFGAKTYRIASAITVSTVAVKLQGLGFVEGPSPGNGTWLKVDTTGFTPITFSGTAARGGGIADIAFFQAHTATQNASWAPTGYDYLVRIQDCLGGVDIHNVFLCSINKGIYCDNSGRLDIHRLRGQVFTTGVEIDDCFDVPRLRSIHFWPFSTTNSFVMAYSQANCDAMLFRRSDGAFIDQAFVFGVRSMFRFSGGTAGVTTKFYIGQAYADFVQYGVLVEGAGTDGLIDSLTTQGQAFGSAGSPVAGAVGIRVTAPSCRLQIGKLRCDVVQDNAIRVEQYGNRLDIFALRCVNFNTQGNGSAAVHIVDSGTNPANLVYLGSPPLLEGTTGPLQNSSTNGVLATGTPAGSAAKPGLGVGSTNTGLFLPASNTLAASAGGVEILRATSSGGLTFGAAPGGHALELATPVSTGNRVLITGAATGSGAGIQAQGGDANVALLLADKGSGSIQASSNGGLTLKLDATGANPVNYVGIRAGTGSTAALVYGAGSATNVDLQLGAQGSGLVRGVTAPTADNSTALATTAWVRSLGLGSSVSSVAGRTGAVTLAVADVSGAAPLASPVFSGVVQVNNAGGGNLARIAGAATTGAVVLGVDAGSADANVNVTVGSPKGTGYISAQTADSATTGGNARGTNAVDWQTARTAATQVASGTTATIAGGTGNTASGLQSAVLGGTGNIASGNQAVAAGNGTQATGTWSTALGRLTLADATASVATGFGARSHGIYGARVHGTMAIATNGDAQLADYVLAGRSTAGAAVRLTADGAAAGAANIANIPNNTAWTGTLMVTARDITTGDSGHWVFAYVALNRKASASTTATANSGATFSGALAGTTGLATTALALGVDTTNGGLNLTFTPPNTDTWDVVAVYRTAEVQ